MSKLGYINNIYGKQFNIAIANTYSYNVLSGSNLPTNTIIISSNIDEDGNDTGSYSMIATDYQGNPVRLTYNIKLGNGLNKDNDIVSLNIDNYTIKAKNNELSADINYLNHTNLYVDNNRLNVDEANINDATISERGILAVDENSIISDDSILSVNTEKLQYGDNETSTYGIVTSSDKSIIIDNGIISLNQDFLPLAENNEPGLAKGDELTVKINEGRLEIETENLQHAGVDNHGIIFVDDNSITSNEGELSVNTNSISVATNVSRGILNVDGNTIDVTDDNKIYIPEYSNMLNLLNSLNDELNNNSIELEKIKTSILSQTN